MIVQVMPTEHVPLVAPEIRKGGAANPPRCTAGMEGWSSNPVSRTLCKRACLNSAERFWRTDDLYDGLRHGNAGKLMHEQETVGTGDSSPQRLRLKDGATPSSSNAAMKAGF
jgi:hypothetical protein